VFFPLLLEVIRVIEVIIVGRELLSSPLWGQERCCQETAQAGTHLGQVEEVSKSTFLIAGSGRRSMFCAWDALIAAGRMKRKERQT